MDHENMNRNEKAAGYRRLIPLLYFAALIVMLLIVVANIALKSTPGSDFGLDTYVTMNDGWVSEDEKNFEISNIDELRTADSSYVPIYHKLPLQMTQDESIVFRSKNCSVTVLIDGTEVYTTDIADAPFYNHSPGTRWNVIDISTADSGKNVQLNIEQAYQDGRAKVDNFYYGDRAAILLYLIHTKIAGIVISLLIFFVGIVFTAAWMVLNWKRIPKNHSLLWLALFAMFTSCWCLLETNLFQLFSQNLRLIQVVDNMMLVIAGLPLYLYLDSVYGVFRYRLVRIICGLDISYILLSTLSQILGLWDYHQTLNGAITTYGIVIAILLFCLIRQHNNLKKFSTKSDRFFDLLQQAGILMIGIGVLGDLVRYLMMDVMDRAFIIRIGLLCFIICFGAGNIYQMILLVKKGMEAEFISQLAYQDGLTRVGNRTAYQEHLQHLKADCSSDPMALVMFDINSLKLVNDTLGHKSGDELIQQCADILRNTFWPDWKVYRIGGDEFMAITHGKNVQSSYSRSVSNLADAIDKANEEGRDYTISIAHGVAFCASITAETIESAEKEADRLMYKDKYRIKFSNS